MRNTLLLFTFALNTFAASPLIFGGRGGADFTAGNNTLTNSLGLSDHSYLIGPTVGVRLPFGLSVEGDALFNRQTLGLPQFAGISGLNTHLDAWEFPMMLKLTAGHSSIAPVFGAGVSIRHIDNFSNLGSVPSLLFNGSTTPNSVGFVAGAGLRFKAGPLDVTPEFRYTHWNGTGLVQSLINMVSPTQNEVQVLLGVTF